MQLNKDETRQYGSLNKYVACNRPKISFDASLILKCAIRCEIDSARDYAHGQIVARKLPQEFNVFKKPSIKNSLIHFFLNRINL